MAERRKSSGQRGQLGAGERSSKHREDAAAAADGDGADRCRMGGAEEDGKCGDGGDRGGDEEAERSGRMIRVP